MLEKQVARKERILSAASQVFLAVGFEKTSTAEIARLAKVSKREMYSLFSDKRALLAAVIGDLQSGMQGRMDNSWSSGSQMEEVLVQSAQVIQSFILSEPFGKLIRIVAAEAYHSPTIAKQFFRSGPGAGRKATARYLEKQMKAGLLRKANPLRAADDFLDLVVGAQLLTAVVLGQHEPSRPRLSDTKHAVEVFLMIYATGAPRRTVKSRPRSTK